MTFLRSRSLGVLLAAALVLAVAVPWSAWAAPSAASLVLDGDFVGGTKVGTDQSLRLKAPDLYIPCGELSTMEGRELWSRDSSSRRAMASTTKIMTAIVVLESGKLDETVTVGKLDLSAGESGMGLRAGEELTVRELLAGMLIQSGNDAAMALAEHVGGSIPGFVKMMNDKAARLDLADTHFMNPHGLDVPNHYTSAADLTAMARYAMRFPLFRQMVGTSSMRLVDTRYTHVLKSTNMLLGQYQGAEGIKTGWTDDAGYCVVAAAKRGQVELVATIMGANSEGGRFQQAKRLLDWGFAHYQPTLLSSAGDRAGNVLVSDYVERTVPAEVAETTVSPIFDLAGDVKRHIALQPDVEAPVRQGQRLGTLTVYQGDRLITQVPLVAARSVPAPTFWQRIGIAFSKAWRGIFGS